MTYLRSILIMTVAILLAVALFMIFPGAQAERKGEDSDPPDHGDWIIDSPGNYIGNETDWHEIIQNPPPAEPTDIFHEDHIKIDGNIIIRNGGELTLLNTTLNMTDHSGYHIIIEEGGSLIMEKGNELMSVTKIHNNNGSYVGYFKLEGSLSMNRSYLERIDVIYVNSSTPTLLLIESHFTTLNHVQIRDQTLSFTNISMTSWAGTALSLDNCTMDLNWVTLNSFSNDTESDVLSVRDSRINATRLRIVTSSDRNAGLYLESSWFNGTGECRISSTSQGIPVYVTSGSYLHLYDGFQLFSRGDRLIYGEDSTIKLQTAVFGYAYWVSTIFFGGFEFDGCDVTMEEIEFFRINTHVIEAKDTDITITNCNIWNVTEDAIFMENGNIDIDTLGFYNISANAMNLNGVSGRIFNVTMDEDDRNWTTGRPYPPIYSGYGYGVTGYGIYAHDSDLDILNCTFSAMEMDSIHAVSSTVDIRGCNFRPTGWLDDTEVNGIYMDNSTGQIIENTFNTPYRDGGFDMVALNMVPMDLTDFTQLNNFSDGRTFQAKFTLYVKVVNELGGGVSDVDVNLSNNIGEDTRITSTIIGGWIRSPFTVPGYEIFRHTDRGDESFENHSFNDHHLVVSKEYRTYNFSITRELDVNITRSMNLEVVLNVSTSELSVKSAGIFPRVLQGEEIEITVVLRNFGEGWANNVNISYYFALNDTLDWTWFGSTIMSIPGLFDGGNHTMYTTFTPVNAPLGDYMFKIIIDPEDTLMERDETNNEFFIPEAFSVLSRPQIVIDYPIDMEFINGTYVITGYAEDDYENDLDIQLRIDDLAVTVADITNNGEILIWSFIWETTVYDSTKGQDKYPNGEHIISAICTNSNPSGYDLSDWFNVTVTVVNPPELEWLHPFADEFINITGTIPLYTVEVKVNAFHDLTSIRYQVDDGPMLAMSNLGTIFKSTLDTSKYPDGYHTLTYNATYGYGYLSDSVTILLNSPNEESLPSVDFDHDVTELGLTVQGTAVDDFKVEWVKIRLDDGPWLLLNESLGNFTSFEHFWTRGLLSPDTHKITVRAYDGFDHVDKVQWFVVGILYDLSITDIEVPSNVREDDWVNFTVVVKNTGPYTTPPINLVLYIGNIIRTSDGLTIPANSEQRIKVSWHAKPGNHTVSAEINPTQKNDETNPSNNIHIDDNLVVESKGGGETSEETDITGILIVALVIMVILGVVAAAVTLTGKRKGSDQP